jgi:hypothetical protein
MEVGKELAIPQRRAMRAAMSHPSGAKALVSLNNGGTAEAVPFPKYLR